MSPTATPAIAGYGNRTSMPGISKPDGTTRHGTPLHGKLLTRHTPEMTVVQIPIADGRNPGRKITGYDTPQAEKNPLVLNETSSI